MDQDKLKQIYDKTLDNSVGTDKKCPFKKILKSVSLNIAIVTLLLTFMASSLTGCMNIKTSNLENSQQNTEVSVTEKDKINGFSTYEISVYQQIRLYELLNKNGFTDYTEVGSRRNYNYTADQYKSIPELDSTYLYGFYTCTTEETLIEICKSLGYDDIKSFLIQNGYVDEKGEPSVSVWYEHNKIEMSQIMKSAQEEMNRGTK